MNAGFEQKFLGRGISYYARCDVDYYKNEDVVVIGSGNCACYAAEYLSKFANKVTMVHHYDHLRAVTILKEKINKTQMLIFYGIHKSLKFLALIKLRKPK